MARDKDGYLGPSFDGEGKTRKTHWEPERIELRGGASAGECECPCNLAHRYELHDACSESGPIVADAVTDRRGLSFYLVPLCAICSTAQLSKMEEGVSVPKLPSHLESGNVAAMAISLVVMAAIVWLIADGETALAVALGMFAGVLARDRV